MKTKKMNLLGLGLILIYGKFAEAKLVRYELEATQSPVNLSGKKTVDFALLLNGQIPAPTLEFTEGDEAEILVKNRLPNDELSIHWHGILLPSEMDGVPYVNTPPLFPGEQFLFKFKIRQSGTYWYHSHTNVQEQKGLYGPIVIHPQGTTAASAGSIQEAVLVLSDWSDENASSILKNLRKDGDYYLYKKGTIRSWLGAIQAGSLGNFLTNEWTRMGGMDLSDVGYDAFLINGKRESTLSHFQPGKPARLRIINASASSYFYISLGKDPMKVIAADGVDIQPLLAKEILMGMAETYDVLFTPSDRKSVEFKATAQDGTGSASVWLGRGEKIAAPIRPAPDLYATMSHEGHEAHGGHGGHGSMDMHASSHPHHSPHHSPHRAFVETLTVEKLQAQQETTLPAEAPVHRLRLELDGDMSRYIWFINGKAIHQERTLLIREGERVEITYVNKTMMHHPMHLHGHFFRVLNSHGDFSPLKHTVDVPPHETRKIEFLANETGEWMLHCHNLYHLKTGMARVVKYAGYSPSPSILNYQQHDPHLHDHWYFYGKGEIATNHAQGFLRLSNTWNEFDFRVEGRNTEGVNFSFREPWEIEGDLFYRRWFNRFISLVAGGTLFDKNASALVGVGYLLPFLIRSGLYLNHEGHFRFDLDKRFQWTQSVFSDFDFTWRPGQAHSLGTPIEFEVSLMFAPTWTWSAGLMFTNRNIGFGVEAQF